jgi:restriction endonuclease S subunit
MAKLSALERAIENIDEKIAALQLARQHLVEQLKTKRPAPARPRAVPIKADEPKQAS